MVVPFTTTLAPGIGTPLSSTTVPFIGRLSVEDFRVFTFTEILLPIRRKLTPYSVANFSNTLSTDSL